MDEYEEYDEKMYKPISPLGYIGFQILYAIPIVGLILAVVLAFAPKNENIKNFARAQILVIIIGLILVLVLCIAAVISGVTPDQLEQLVKQALPE